jgi:hypothetical protein
VPFNKYPSLLHFGERVLTSKENQEYSSGKNRGIVINSSPVFNIDSRTDQAQVAQIAAEVTSESNRQLIAELRAQGVF